MRSVSADSAASPGDTGRVAGVNYPGRRTTTILTGRRWGIC